jgi:hypothetical protein
MLALQPLCMWELAGEALSSSTQSKAAAALSTLETIYPLPGTPSPFFTDYCRVAKYVLFRF